MIVQIASYLFIIFYFNHLVLCTLCNNNTIIVVKLRIIQKMSFEIEIWYFLILSIIMRKYDFILVQFLYCLLGYHFSKFEIY